MSDTQHLTKRPYTVTLTCCTFYSINMFPFLSLSQPVNQITFVVPASLLMRTVTVSLPAMKILNEQIFPTPVEGQCARHWVDATSSLRGSTDGLSAFPSYQIRCKGSYQHERAHLTCSFAVSATCVCVCVCASTVAFSFAKEISFHSHHVLYPISLSCLSP